MAQCMGETNVIKIQHVFMITILVDDDLHHQSREYSVEELLLLASHVALISSKITCFSMTYSIVCLQ